MGFLMDSYITGERISHLREEKGLSQLELGEALGVSWDTVSKWEDDTVHPDISMLNDLAKALGVSIDQLLEDVEIVNSNQGIDINESAFHVCLRIALNFTFNSHLIFIFNSRKSSALI